MRTGRALSFANKNRGEQPESMFQGIMRGLDAQGKDISRERSKEEQLGLDLRCGSMVPQNLWYSKHFPGVP